MEEQRWQFSDDDWQVLKSFLPDGWEHKAKELKAMDRYRVIRNADDLLRYLLIHLVDGCSLRETAVRIRTGFGIKLSDVALLKRLNASGEWFRWMGSELMKKWIALKSEDVFGKKYRVRIIDGTTVEEPGATGTTWRIHYSVGLPDLVCDELYVTNPKTAEGFCNFGIRPGDLLLGDRFYGIRRAVAYVRDRGGDVIVRINLTNLPVEDLSGNRIDILQKLRRLNRGEIGDWSVRLVYEGKYNQVRICAIRKSREAAEKALQKTLKENSKKGRKVKDETLESTEYVFVITTLTQDELSAERVLEMYRGRWQVELVFKRLKSLLGLGHLRKKDIEGSKAWIHGKLFTALLIESIISAGDAFFPWGYPIRIQDEPESK